ncbi:hypothetical protein IKF15_00765 [Candidatus Saccharibacteria bacterium]|nr:hypothetical protein [Candidatus Saccharibacteria bacterium]
MQDLDKFIEDLLREKGFSEEDGEGWEELKKDLTQRLLDAIDKAAINNLSREKAEELSSRLDDENFSDKDAVEFMKNSGVDLQKVAAETMYRFKALFLGEKTAEQLVDEMKAA